MTFRNRFLFIVFTIVCLIGLVFQWRDHNQSVDEYDAPKQLSGKKEILNLRYIQRNCDCADWIEFKRHKDSTGIKEEDYFFLEPSSANMGIPPSYWALEDSGYALRVTGEFYKGNAIPYNYLQKTDSKPERARVFYYTSSEVVKPE